MKYRVLTYWPKSKPWGYLPEHNNVTLKRARQIVKQAAHWQPCGLRQRIETVGGKLVREYRSRLASPERRERIYRIYLPWLD